MTPEAAMADYLLMVIAVLAVGAGGGGIAALDPRSPPAFLGLGAEDR